MKKIILILLFIFSFANANSNDIEWGVTGSYNVNRHSAAFYGLPGVPSCCQFYESAWGDTWKGGILFGFPKS